jgi:preprotein translocase subunit SecA
MLIKLLTKVFGSRNDRTLRRMRKAVNLINAMEPAMEKLSDDELKGKPLSSALAWKKAKAWRA